MKEKTLVILAAGMGSRFGGMKQVEPVGPNGEFIIDYSIFSAARYGFNKIVFVIKEENYDIFKSSIGSRIEDKVKVEYAFQKLTDIPEGFTIPEGRVKPWGTAHAIYAARDYINGNFGVITSDDFYGDEAFKQLSDHLEVSDNYVVVGYPVGDTLSENGSVKRGIVINENGVVKSIIESKCIRNGNMVECEPLDKSKESFNVDPDYPCSMLLNGFNKSFLETIGNEMYDSFKNNSVHLLDYEMLIPDIMDDEIKNGKTIDVINTKSKWMGVTYKNDTEALRKHILNEIDNDIYPEKLWDKEL